MRSPSASITLRQFSRLAAVVSALTFGSAVLHLVFTLAPGSVTLALPARLLGDLPTVAGVTPGVVLDSDGAVPFTLADPSLLQRLLYLALVLPGLVVAAEVARRLATLLRRARENDPFSTRTADDLNRIASITILGGIGAFAVGLLASWALAQTMLVSGADLVPADPARPPFGWMAAGLLLGGFAQMISRGVEVRTEPDPAVRPAHRPDPAVRPAHRPDPAV